MCMRLHFFVHPPQGLTENQNRLLYMVSLYTHKADTRGDRDHWLRKPALVVLLYEGIVANVLDFDYAPQSELIENRRIWMNVSQVRLPMAAHLIRNNRDVASFKHRRNASVIVVILSILRLDLQRCAHG